MTAASRLMISDDTLIAHAVEGDDNARIRLAARVRKLHWMRREYEANALEHKANLHLCGALGVCPVRDETD